MREGFLIFAVVIVGLAAILTPLLGFAAWVDSASCSAKAEVMGVRHQWGVMTDCMVEFAPGKWAPLKSYRTIDGSN